MVYKLKQDKDIQALFEKTFRKLESRVDWENDFMPLNIVRVKNPFSLSWLTPGSNPPSQGRAAVTRPPPRLWCPSESSSADQEIHRRSSTAKGRNL